MWKRNTALLLFLTLTSVAFTPGCATITRRRTQRVPVTSSPMGATVSVNGQQQGVTPLEIRMIRKAKGQVIRIESPGYNPVEIRLRRRMSVGPILANLLLGAIPGSAPAIAWDIQNDDVPHNTETSLLIWTLGALAFGGIFTLIDNGSKGFEQAPKELAVTLTKADGTLRVDTILLDADDFRNIKWIRIRRD
jgi:hypothetical protein